MATKTQENTPPELRFLLEGEERFETREAIVAAFYDICQGDPTSYPVQYALVQKAHLRAMARHAARTDEVLTAALQLAKVMQQETGKQENIAQGLGLHMESVNKRVGEAIASEKRLAKLMENSVGSIQSQASSAVRDIEKAAGDAVHQIGEDSHAAINKVWKTAESLDRTSLFTAMSFGVLIGGIIMATVYHLIIWQWP